MADPEKDKPQDQPQSEVPPEPEDTAEEGGVGQDPDPEFDQPLTKPDGQPSWKEKETSKWPIWVILGAIVLGVGWVIISKMKAPPESDAAVHALTTAPGPNVPLDPDTLMKGALYEFRASTPILKIAGENVTTATRVLPGGSQVVILDNATICNGKWYQVQVGVTASDTGWVSVKSLLGKKVVMVRDRYKMP